MERKEGKIKAGCVKSLWSFMVVFLCAVPCGALTIGSGETLNVGTGYEFEQINDSLLVYGTLNMCPGAYVTGGIKATIGGTVNIWGGAIGAGQSVVVEGYSSTTVTVYGTDFAITTLYGTAAFDDPVNPTKIIPEGKWEGVLTVDGGLISLKFVIFIPVYLDSTGTPPPPPPPPPVTYVDIDIKPGSDPNPINPGSNGLIPVAILTTNEFDAADVNSATVTLAGAEVAVRGKSDKTMARLEDVDGDGDNDLLLQIETESWADLWEGGEVILTGKTYDGEDIKGTDEVIIVPPE